MNQPKHYIYDEDACRFVPVENNKRELFLLSMSLWILNGMVFGAIFLSLISTFYATPAELALKAENEFLIEEVEESQRTMNQLMGQLDELAAQDNEMYRSILGLNDIPMAERNASMGGARPQELDLSVSPSTAQLLAEARQSVRQIEQRIRIQNDSYEEIKRYFNTNSDKLKHIPAIKPVDNVLTSAYGMRTHPVMGYKTMHAGIDFRSDIGSPVYATGNGTISSRRYAGTFGRLIVIDHGYGFETRYAHLSSYANGIQKGQRVERGELIGYTGNSGMVSGPHLHYEVLRNGKHVDPLMYLFANTTPEEFKLYQELAATEHASMD
jgi:murein DD-endopeptidase MepM/ murein hydrolase activator NlpD